jgi:hypothetical protein
MTTRTAWALGQEPSRIVLLAAEGRSPEVAYDYVVPIEDIGDEFIQHSQGLKVVERNCDTAKDSGCRRHQCNSNPSPVSARRFACHEAEYRLAHVVEHQWL